MIKRVINHKLKLIKVNILGFYQDHIKEKLSPSQVITLQILLYLISVHKTVLISKELVLISDRTQWQNTNILMISVAWNQRALPIYWHIFSHKEASNLTE